MNKSILTFSIIIIFFIPAPLAWPQDLPLEDHDTTIDEALDAIEEDRFKERRMIDVLEVQDMDLTEVLSIIAEKANVSIVAQEPIEGKVTVYLKDIDLDDLLRIILDTHDLAYYEGDELITIMTQATFLEEYGHAFDEEVQTRIVPLAHRSSADMLEILTEMKSPSGKILTHDSTNTLVLMDAPNALGVMLTLIEEMDVARETKTFLLQFIPAGDIAQKIQEILTVNVGRLELDAETNTVTVTDTLEKIHMVEGLLKALDRQDREIFLEAKILQIVLNEEHQEGVDWEAIVSSHQEIDAYGNLSVGSVSDEDYPILLEALDTVGEIHTLADVDMRTEKGHPSRIAVYPLPSSTEPEELNFALTSSIGIEDFLTILIAPGEGSLEISEGSTIVIGSLFKDIKVATTRRIPVLGHLPLVGFAFRNERERLYKTEIIVFVTPRIVVKED